MTLLGLALVLACSACGPAPTPPADDGPAAPRILLVRHGETTPDGSRDPALSDAGDRRAESLARMLRDAGVTRILTTDYRRTRATAGPLALAVGVTPEIYDPADFDDLARSLRSATGVTVVVGHSNTTPELVRALGGAPGDAIAETDHGRLYVVVPSGADAATVLLRY